MIVNVTTEAVQIAPARSRVLIAANRSDTEIQLFVDGKTPVWGEGIPLAPERQDGDGNTIYGGTWNAEPGYRGTYPFAVYAMHNSSGNKTLVVQLV